MNTKDEIVGSLSKKKLKNCRFRKFHDVHYNLQAGNNAKIIYKNNYEQQICTNKELIGCQKNKQP